MTQPNSTSHDFSGDLYGPVVPAPGPGDPAASAMPPAEPAAPTASADSEDSLGSSVSWMLVLTAIQKALGFVRSVVVCRLLDPVNLGLMGLSIAFVETALPICLLSIPAIFCRYIEKYRRQQRSRAFSLSGHESVCMPPGCRIVHHCHFSRDVGGVRVRGNCPVVSRVAVRCRADTCRVICVLYGNADGLQVQPDGKHWALHTRNQPHDPIDLLTLVLPCGCCFIPDRNHHLFFDRMWLYHPAIDKGDP